MSDAESVRLDKYTLGTYSPGASLPKQILWYYLGTFLFSTSLIPASGLKCAILRWFGAEVGKGVCIKPHVKVKFPWKLEIGDHVWLGEGSWIDNVFPVQIGSHTCISQGVYLCTGNHDWSDPNFQLTAKAIVIGRGCWLAAKAVVGPGVNVGDGAVLGLGSVATKSLLPMTVYIGNPAEVLKSRKIRD